MRDSPQLAVIGLGYVGLPLVLAFAEVMPSVGFDIDSTRVTELQCGSDRNREVTDQVLTAAGVRFSSDPECLSGVQIFIVAVPTPVDANNQVDLAPLRTATTLVGHYLKPGGLVIFESTVYPGCTEGECIPLLQQISGLLLAKDFGVGFSPERINPGDRHHSLKSIVKVVSANNLECLDRVDEIYLKIIQAGTYRAPSIAVAEAAKALENTQRDVNIALMNEFSRICERMGLDTSEVLAAARTKWNFMPFSPGLVGGHCIGVDPYYLIHQARVVGVHPELIAAARRINDGMASYIIERVLRLLTGRRIAIFDAKILLMGITFKEDCSDLRNTRVATIAHELGNLGSIVHIIDPTADAAHCLASLGLTLIESPAEGFYDLLILAVPHQAFRAEGAALRRYLSPNGQLFDLKAVLPKQYAEARL